MKDITKLLKESNSNIIKGTISSGGVILGIRIENFKNVLIDDDKLSNDLSEKVEKGAGIKGFISTDELPKYGISKEDRDKIEKAFECGEKDTVIFVADKKDGAVKAIEIIEKEVKK